MGDGWYVSRAGQVFGPFTWEHLLALAREGSIGADDLVMRPGATEWARADTVPAFTGSAAAPPVMAVDAPTPVAPAAASTESADQLAPATHAVQAQDPLSETSTIKERAPRKRPTRRAMLIVAAAIAVVLLAGAAVRWAPDLLRDKGTLEPAKAGNVIETESAGSVQRNRIVVRLKDGATKADVDQLASQLTGGRVVGQWRDLGFYTIEFDGTTEDKLAAALETASQAKGIRSALPDRVPKQ